MFGDRVLFVLLKGDTTLSITGGPEPLIPNGDDRDAPTGNYGGPSIKTEGGQHYWYWGSVHQDPGTGGQQGQAAATPVQQPGGKVIRRLLVAVAVLGGAVGYFGGGGRGAVPFLAAGGAGWYAARHRKIACHRSGWVRTGVPVGCGVVVYLAALVLVGALSGPVTGGTSLPSPGSGTPVVGNSGTPNSPHAVRRLTVPALQLVGAQDITAQTQPATAGFPASVNISGVSVQNSGSGDGTFRIWVTLRNGTRPPLANPYNVGGVLQPGTLSCIGTPS